MKRSLLVCLIAGCGVAPGSPGDVTDGTGDGSGSGSGSGTMVPKPVWDGTYQLVSRVDVTVEHVLPAQAEEVVSTLRALSTNPAHALITIADEAGVPAVGELFGLIPGPIQDRLEGWINDEIAKVRVGGVPVTEFAGRIASLADTALTQFAVDGELTLQGVSARHRLTALDLMPAGLAVRVPITGLAGDVLTQDTTAAITSAGALTLGEQHFGLNYGEYAWQGVDAASVVLFGAGVRDALGAAVNCPNVAHSVAGRCVLGVCVGHEDLLTRICEGGLDAIVDLAHDRMAELRFEVLHLANGAAMLVDVDGDRVADQITGGTWQAELDLGQGLRHAPATFAGTR
jgi:hypothetical protein